MPQDALVRATEDPETLSGLELSLIRAGAHQSNMEGFLNRASSCLSGRIRLSYFMPTTIISLFGLYATIIKYLSDTRWDALASYLPAAGFALLLVCVRLSRQWYIEERQHWRNLKSLHERFQIEPSVASETLGYYDRAGRWAPSRAVVVAVPCATALIILAVNHFHSL